MSYIELCCVTKEYDDFNENIKILKNINLEIKKGELVVITGPSCTGKTTILNLIGKIDDVTDGKIIVDDEEINNIKGKKLINYRRSLGFCLDAMNILEDLTVKENVLHNVQNSKNNDVDVSKLLKKLGLAKKEDEFPFLLSKEEKVKLSIAKAMIKNPKLILIDELIDNLSLKDAAQILRALKQISRKEKTTIIITSSNNNICPIANKVIKLKNNGIESIKINKKPKAVGDLSW